MSDMKWIPVTEKLPEKNGFYLVTVKSRWLNEGTIEVAIAHRSKKNTWDMPGKIFAWMPLPEPYKEEQDE